jgi:parvulin-like peptidyl-prolyl isomerase
VGNHLRQAVGLTLLVLLAGPVAAEPLNRIVLQVNDRIATLGDFEAAAGERLAALNQAELDAEERQRQLERLPAEVLRLMLEDMLVQSRADQLGIRVGEAEIEEMMAQVQEMNGFAGREELARAVAQSGRTWEEFRQEMARSRRYREVVSRELQSRIKLEEDDLRIVYRDNPDLFRVPEERLLKEVVVLDSAGLSAGEMEALGQEIHRRLDAGEQIEAVVAPLKEAGRTSAVIDLGWVPKGDLDAALETAIDGVAPGRTSEPVVGRGGLHVLLLLDRHEPRMRPFDEVADAIHARERERLLTKEFPKYLRELERQSHVVANPPPGAEDFRRLAETTEAPDPLEVFRRPKPAAAAPAAPAPEPSPSPPPTPKPPAA